MDDLRTLLRAPNGGVNLSSIDTRATPGFDGDKKAGKEAVKALDPELKELQSMLAADGYTGGNRRLLLVVQGMDTSGKGGLIKHAVGIFDPGGVRPTSFTAPTEEELQHDFLWRVEKAVPLPGQIGIFDRSHYEDVLIAKVHELADAEEIERRYGAINDFERRLAEEGVTLVKCMLHISKDEQRDRLLARLDRPHKVWKFKPEDVDERGRWDEYRRAYEVAIERCTTDAAPWYVIPSDRKWYRTWAVATLLRDALRDMALTWPDPEFDLEEERRRLTDEE
jgi:PPK2 family polyphosphate:nucleotide phosphotransferase